MVTYNCNFQTWDLVVQNVHIAFLSEIKTKSSLNAVNIYRHESKSQFPWFCGFHIL